MAITKRTKHNKEEESRPANVQHVDSKELLKTEVDELKKKTAEVRVISTSHARLTSDLSAFLFFSEASLSISIGHIL